MKKIIFISIFLVTQIAYSFGQQAKYIFYMIGDGMGANHVNLTEIYLAHLQGRNGIEPLIFSQFPFSSVATTYSLSHGVTDSAAGGTALAVGKKTKNGVIGMDSTATTPYKSIAYAAKEKGLKVGITTSVSIDHATPASFYAHQPSRSRYYEIASDLIKSDFDFFAGAGFLKPSTTFDKKEAPSIYPQIEKAGYHILKGYDSFKKHNNKSEKLILTNVDGTSPNALNYAIDQKDDDLKLADITSAAIQSLTSNNQKGFFLMVEGGKIDWSSHANDAATTIHEVLDFNESVKLAYEFYKKHPDETLIVVTADHETGGLTIGNGGSKLNTRVLKNQSISQGELSALIASLRKSKPNATWDEVKALLADNLGLWENIKVSEKDEKPIYDTYLASFVNHEQLTLKTLYANDDKIASLSIALLNRLASLAWGSTSHSAAAVPVFAIGVGADKFSHKMENTDVPKKIAEAAGLSL
ncbi:alkaline phosphatase [Sphingobacterium sp. SGG-5]|nr:alkaline phosphatase [Sphingobacterium sp. SGG-5]